MFVLEGIGVFVRILEDKQGNVGVYVEFNENDMTELEQWQSISMNPGTVQVCHFFLVVKYEI